MNKQREYLAFTLANCLHDSKIPAASWEEAARYGDKICMVVPFLLDGDTDIVIKDNGWSSSGVTVIAGPWDRGDKRAMRKAAKLILAAYKQGYRQIDGVLFWAITVVSPKLVRDYIQILEWGIKSDDPDVNLKAVQIAGKIGAPALCILERALEHCSLSVCQEAVRMAGKIGAVEFLANVMTHEEEFIRWEAAYTIGKIGKRALLYVERAAKNHDPKVRQCAVAAAGQIGALEIIEQAMTDSDPHVRQEAMRIAGKMARPRAIS
jgi:HEAT repeat protein